MILLNFSIILPVRNGGEYVKDCVNSILCQTHTDFKLHILDNNSNDGTLEWLNSLNDERIEITTSSVSLSIEENWARVISLNKNEYMTLIGHDDRLLPNFLEEMKNLMNQFPNASLYQSHFNYINAKGDFVKKCKEMSEIYYSDNFLKSQIFQSFDSMGTGYVMRSKDYDLIGGIPNNYPGLIFADYELWLRLIDKSYLATTRLTLFEYRLHESVSKTFNAVGYQKAYLLYLKFLIYFIQFNEKNKNVINNYGHKFLLFYCSSLSFRLLKESKVRRTKKVSQYIAECKQLSTVLLKNGKKFYPYLSLKILFAILIDNSFLLSICYRIYRKIKYNN